jgi:ABC-type antimicrobial peptide transport system permease subunit
MSLVARSKDAGGNLAMAIAREAHSLESRVAIYDIKTMDQWLLESLARRRFAMQALGLFAAVAAFLAAAGIYGMISYDVAQRTREIGVRMALGARRGNVLSLVIGSGLRLAAAGSLIGLAGCLAVTRLMSSLLYDVSPRDPWTLALVSLLPMAIAALASWAPARNAARIDPMTALRSE